MLIDLVAKVSKMLSMFVLMCVFASHSLALLSACRKLLHVSYLIPKLIV